MRNISFRFRFSFLSLCTGAVAVLAVVYIGSIATVMTYAALTVEFSQSVKNDEAAVGVLESNYLASVSNIETINYQSLGYVAPTKKIFVPQTSMTALR